MFRSLQAKQHLLLLIAIISQLFAIAQKSHKKDSLFAALNKSAEDTNRVELLLKVGSVYDRSKPDSAIYFYEQANQLSRRLDYTVGRLKYIANVGEALNVQGKFKEAMKLNLESIELAKKINQPKRLAAAYSNTAISYYYATDYNACTECFIKAISILEKEPLSDDKDRRNLAGLYANVTGILSEIKKDSEAYVYGIKAINLSRSMNDSSTLGRTLNNLATVLINQKKLDSAMQCATQAKAVAAADNDLVSMNSSLLTLAYIHSKLLQLDVMKQYADSAISISKALNDSDGIDKAMIYQAYYFFNKKDYKQAKSITERALQIAQQNELDNHLDAQFLLMSDIALAMGNMDDYYRYRALRDSIEDAVFSDKILQNTQELDKKYEVEKKEQQLKLQSAQIATTRLWIAILAVAIASILLIAFVVSRSLRHKQQLQRQQILQLEKEKQLMAAQSVLKGQEEERTRLAKDLHDGLGGILSGVKYSLTNMKDNMIITADNADRFERTMNMLDHSISELRRVAHNMMPEALTKAGLDTALRDMCNGLNQNGKLQLTYQSFNLDDGTIPQNTASVIYRIIQELLNNVLKHADATTALVQLVRSNNTLSITTEDNGKGFDKNTLKDNAGMGYSSLQNRVTFLQGTFDVQSAPGNGTSVNIEIPNINL